MIPPTLVDIQEAHPRCIGDRDCDQGEPRATLQYEYLMSGRRLDPIRPPRHRAVEAPTRVCASVALVRDIEADADRLVLAEFDLWATWTAGSLPGRTRLAKPQRVKRLIL